MALKDHISTSRVLNHEMWLFARQQMSARTVQGSQQQHAFSALWPCHWLTLMLHNSQKFFNDAFNNEPEHKNSMTLTFKTNLCSVFNIIIVASVIGDIVKNDRCQRALDIIRLVHMMAWGLGTCLSPFLYANRGTLNSCLQICVVLRPVALLFI